MNLECVAQDSGSISDPESLIEAVLSKDENNFAALYGKSLILCKQGKIEESVECLNKAVEIDSSSNRFQVNRFKQMLSGLLKPKPPVKLIVLDELKRQHDDIKQASYLFNFMTFPKPQIPSNTSPKIMTLQPGPSPRTTTPEYICCICHKVFAKRFSLNRHMYLHSGIKNYSCSVCGRSFIQKSDMLRHETIHSSDLNVVCTHPGCEMRFKTPKNMRSHLIVHTNERPFICTVCGRCFKINRLLRFHAGLHTELKPFYCDICGKGFPAKPNLKSHLRCHMIGKPFGCFICKSSFKRRYDLNFHQKHQHQFNSKTRSFIN